MIYVLIGIALVILVPVVLRAMKKSAEAKAARQAEIASREATEKMRREEKERAARAAEEVRRKEEEKERAIMRNPNAAAFRVNTQQTEATVHSLNVSEFDKAAKHRFVAIDIETTGLSQEDDEIVELAAVRVEDGQITAEYSQLIDPGVPMPYAASRVNHITDDMLSGKPRIYEALPDFLAFVGDDVIVAHNARFDLQFIMQACMRNRFRIPAATFDTMNYARYWPSASDKKLATLVAAAGVEVGQLHRALDDARALAMFVIATNEKRKKK